MNVTSWIRFDRIQDRVGTGETGSERQCPRNLKETFDQSSSRARDIPNMSQSKLHTAQPTLTVAQAVVQASI